MTTSSTPLLPSSFSLLSSSLKSLLTTDYDIVESFYDKESSNYTNTFVSKEHILTNILPVIAVVFGLLTLTYTLSYYMLVPFFNNNNDDKNTIMKIRKGSYQISNVLINLALGIVGLYHYYITLTDDDDYVSVDERIIGWEDSSIYILSAMQLGYQLWSLIIGIVYVNESKQMIYHHIAVVFVTGMSAFFTKGFRYYNPFFYGMIELSSIPLAIINCFKDNPSLKLKYKKIDTYVRIIFATMFLQLRIIMFIPINIDFLRLCALSISVLFKQNEWLYMIFLSICWLSSFFLMFLQCLWGYVIVKGLLKIFFGTTTSSGSSKRSHNSSSDVIGSDNDDNSVTKEKDKNNTNKKLQ